MTVVVEPAAMALAPGASLSVAVTIGNASDIVEHFEIAVLGLPEGCRFAATPATCKLHPGETGRIELTVSADSSPPPTAGRVVLGVHVQSPYRRQEQRCEELVLTVAAAPGLELAVRPEVVSGRPGAAELTVANRGNTVLDVDLAGSDPEGAVRLEFDQPRLQVLPGQTARMGVRAFSHRSFTGADVRRQLALNARAGELEAQASLVLVQRPLIAGGIARAAGAATAVAAVVAAIVAIAVVANKGVSKADRAAKAAAATSSRLAAAAAAVADQLAASRSVAAAKSASPAGSPTTSAAPTTTSTSTPTASSRPTTTPTGTVTASKAPAGGAATSFDFSQIPGQPVTTANQVVPPTAYHGIVLSSVHSSTGACSTTTSVSLLHLFSPTKVAGITSGAFTTPTGTGASATPAAQGQCNDLALQITLLTPAHQVTLTLVGETAPSLVLPHIPYEAYAVSPGAQPTKTIIDPGRSGTIPVVDTTGKGITEIIVSGDPASADISVLLTSMTISPVS